MKYLISLLLLATHVFAANSTPTTVSSISVAGSTVTVNSTAHGLAVNQGFCLAAPASVCNVVATSATNSFTFTSSGVLACASSCGTVATAKRVIWLNTQTVNGGYQVNYILWLTTTQPISTNGSSAYGNATTSEKAALGQGNFIEVARNQFFPLATTLANAEAQMQNDWTAQQSSLSGSVQPGQFFGNFFDGAGWTQ